MDKGHPPSSLSLHLPFFRSFDIPAGYKPDLKPSPRTLVYTLLDLSKIFSINYFYVKLLLLFISQKLKFGNPKPLMLSPPSDGDLLIFCG